MEKITIIVPCYNEEKTLPLFYTEIKKVIDSLDEYVWELLFVDDGSRDGTLAIIKALHAADSRIVYLSLSRNFGKENAMLAGFDHATGDCCVVIDADLQEPPTVIPQMLDAWHEGYQDVYARRQTRSRQSWLRSKLSKLFYRILNSSASGNLDMLPNVGDFRLLDRRCIDALCQIRETERYTKGLFCWIGYRKKEIVFEQQERVAGSSKWSLWKLMNLALDGITSFSTAPLRVASVAGALIASIAFFFMLFYGIKTIIFGDQVRGFTTIIVVVLFMGGVQLLCIGILGEYIGRIFNESKRRPPYLINEKAPNI